jgi:hypothetical protein
MSKYNFISELDAAPHEPAIWLWISWLVLLVFMIPWWYGIAHFAALIFAGATW